MIELPEATVISRQITAHLSGRKIVNVTANATPHKFAWYSGDPANYPNLLKGRTIRCASAAGNFIEVDTEDRTLIISTPMKYHAVGETPPKKHQLLLEFADRSAVTCTVQMWGAMICVPVGEEASLPDYRIAKQKPSPLSGTFDRAYFNSLFDESTVNLSLKEFLATKQRIPGLGNGVLQDILWNARVHPKRKIHDLTSNEVEAVFAAVKRVLLIMTDQGGRDTERDLFDCIGGYKTILSKNTVDLPCPACGTTIRKEAYLGGAIYFCPTCQR